MDQGNQNPLEGEGRVDEEPNDDLVEQYRTSQTAVEGSGLVGKLKACARRTKLRAQVVKLRHEIKGAGGSLDKALEQLGLVAVSHSPEGLDIGDEMTRMETLQAKLRDSRGALENLQAAKADRSTVKPMAEEVRRLQEEVFQVMVAIGGKLDAVRSDLPEATTHYIAIDHLRRTLEDKKSQLESLEAELGDNAEASAGDGRARLLKILGVIILVAAVCWVGQAIFGSAGRGMGRLERYLPDDPAFVVFLDADSIQNSSLFEDFEGGRLLNAMEKLTEKNSPMKFDITDIEKVMIAGDELDDDGVVVVVQTGEDKSLAELVDLKALNAKIHQSRRRQSERKIEHYKGAEYVATSSYGRRNFVVRLDESVYGLIDNEDLLKEVVDRGRADRSPKFGDEEFRKVYDEVRKADSFFVMAIPGELRREIRSEGEEYAYLAGLRAVGIGASVGGAIDARGIAVFDENAQAEQLDEEWRRFARMARMELRREIDDDRDRIRRYAQAKPDSWERKYLPVKEQQLAACESMLGLLKLTDEIDCGASGAVFTAEVSLNKSELEDHVRPLIKAIHAMMLHELR